MGEISQFDSVATLTVLGTDHSGYVARDDEGRLLFTPATEDYLFAAGQSGELGIGDERGITLVPVRVVEIGTPLVLETAGDARADQRRQWVRVRQELPVRFEHEDDTVTGRTRDYSGGGFQVIFVNGALAVGDVAKTVITLPDGHEVTAKAEVIRETHVGSFSCRFTEIPESQRDRLIREVFAVMRAQRAAASANRE